MTVTAATAVPAHARDARSRRDAALVTIKGASAALVPDGDNVRLVVTGVSPDATFDAQHAPASTIGTYGAITLLDTATAPALIRSTSGDPETEGLVLNDLTYDAASATLEADAASAGGVTGLALLKGAGPTDDDGQLPVGPVEVAAIDTDTRVAASGKPVVSKVFEAASYTVPLEVQYNRHVYQGILMSATVEGEYIGGGLSDCTSGKNFSFHDTNFIDNAHLDTSFEVITAGLCFFKQAVAKYRITVNASAGSTKFATAVGELTVTQVGVRTFVSSCPDAGTTKFTCGVRDIVVAPRVFLYIN